MNQLFGQNMTRLPPHDGTPSMNSSDSIITFCIAVWVACVLFAVYILHIPSAWRPVGYIRDHAYSVKSVLYERIAGGRREWRYTAGDHIYYPTEGDILYLATDMLGAPLT
jgi:hypothetical protein